MGSCPDGDLSWWGVVLEGSYPGGELSGWELSEWEHPGTRQFNSFFEPRRRAFFLMAFCDFTVFFSFLIQENCFFQIYLIMSSIVFLCTNFKFLDFTKYHSEEVICFL